MIKHYERYLVSCFTMDCLNDNIILLPENIFNGDKPSKVKIIRYPAIDYYSLCKLKAEYILEPKVVNVVYHLNHIFH